MGVLPQIDFEAIITCCEVLFGYLDGFVPFRLIGEKGTPNSKVTTEFYEPKELAAKIARIAPQGAEWQEAV